ncbi:MAG: chorismate synthase [Bacteroidetes bacterium]|nr:chorismate synthase [Bacteroidota bacterium]
MPGNYFGLMLRLTTFGESHGTAVGGVLDGFPAGIAINESLIREGLRRRNNPDIPGTTTRKEEDSINWLSGIDGGISTGGPIAYMIQNKMADPSEYDHLKNVFRPSHADYTYYSKYGRPQSSGGGRASGRETVARVVAGEIARLMLERYGINILAFVTQIGSVKVDELPIHFLPETVYNSPVYCPSHEASQAMLSLIENSVQKSDTLGGMIRCVVSDIPAGLGEPVFDKISADLARAMISIPTARAFEFGAGMKSAGMTGSEYNDAFVLNQGKISTKSNNDGGIQGGITNGNDIVFNIAFKPVSSIGMAQKTLNKWGQEEEIRISGRHDVCAVPRIVPVVEAMTALVIADHMLRNHAIKL